MQPCCPGRGTAAIGGARVVAGDQHRARSAAFWKSVAPWALWALLPPLLLLAALWFGRRFAEAVR